MVQLAADRQLAAYRHNSFWQCMDTFREKRLLEELWSPGQSPLENMGVKRCGSW